MTSVFNAPEAANRYDAARNLPDQTMAVWMDALTNAVPAPVDCVLDLGCGTGRFTAALGRTFRCPVIGVEPSAAMLSIAEAQQVPGIEWKLGDAENIPLEDRTVDLVFMSQVFHHLAHPEKAAQEIGRVLAPAGYLAIRNGTNENNQQLEWLRCFPESIKIEEERGRTQQEIEDLVCSQSFTLVSCETISQLFASSYQEYYGKIKNRGLSCLIAISDQAFDSGLRRLQGWTEQQPQDLPVYEPTDLFIFQKNGADQYVMDRTAQQENNDRAQSLITRNENILGGIPVFTGTRVPVKTLFDYLKANHPLDDFLDDFPTVARGQVQQVLEAVGQKIENPDDEAVYEIAA